MWFSSRVEKVLSSLKENWRSFYFEKLPIITENLINKHYIYTTNLHIIVSLIENNLFLNYALYCRARCCLFHCFFFFEWTAGCDNSCGYCSFHSAFVGSFNGSLSTFCTILLLNFCSFLFDVFISFIFRNLNIKYELGVFFSSLPWEYVSI